MASRSGISTGITGLDSAIDYLQMGDNVVFQVEDIDDYRRFVDPYVKSALEKGRRVVYMRFAEHRPIVESSGVTVYKLNARVGFETFSTQVHYIIRQEGHGVFYVFDCLSDLLLTWATDIMIGNFFQITCPYLFELDTIAYFAILRNKHSFRTVARIRETTQVLLEIYKFQGNFCVHPVKAWQRYTPTMFLPHLMTQDEFVPVLNSAEASDLFSYLQQASTSGAERNLDYWDRMFIEAEELLKDPDSPERPEMIERLSRVLIGREKRMLSLIKEYFTLEDLLEIRQRLIGTGFIGGKSAGMLLARNILRKDPSIRWEDHLEIHDSYYIGSDVYYSYIVQNGLWKALMSHKTPEGYFDSAGELKEKMLTGRFPGEIREQFQLMLEYYGQSPIIVRSSSLLEDAFGNAFAGKYQSFFCANQGSPEERYERFEETVRKVFASTMNEDALTYRRQRGLDREDEQMALLVQRVSGSHRKYSFFPELAGVGLSYNTFVWRKGMDPGAGMLRLVFGLGTRAVSRTASDYPRIVALDDPLVKPYGTPEDAGRFSQHFVDILNLDSNTLESVAFPEVIDNGLEEHLDLIGSRDRAASERRRASGGSDVWVLTFDELLSKTQFPTLMSKMLRRLESVYDHPIDMEFTANLNGGGAMKINLLQCRPFQTRGSNGRIRVPDRIDRSQIVFKQKGNFMGGSVSEEISRIIIVDPAGYAALPLSAKYSVARLVGRLNKTIPGREEMPTLLIGPGRWGTTTPTTGIPVSFAEVNNVAAIAEVSYQQGSLVPDLSFGTHFFQDMVEMNIFYMAVYPDREKVLFNEAALASMDNIRAELVPEDRPYADVVRVYDVTDRKLLLVSDMVAQKMICYFD